MADERVFISSVIDDFVDRREAAKAAVELLGFRAIMAENFGARPHSSQQACLDGVRESDIVVLILGRRYGFLAQSGKSVTEEEFNCARESGKPILVFLEKVDREPAQDAFVKRVSAYEEGFHRESFTTPAELKDGVIRALNAVTKARSLPTIDLAEAKTIFDRLHWGGRRTRDRGPWLGCVVIPTLKQQYLSAVLLGNKEFQRNIQKEAVYGDSPVFSSELGVRTEETEESTIFAQSDDRGPRASLEVRTDGALIFGTLLPGEQTRAFSLVRSAVIDENEFRTSLTRFFEFAAKFYGSLKEKQRLTSFMFGGSLSGIEHKMFGKIPDAAANSISVAMHDFADPLPIPREPRSMTFADLRGGVAAANEITELVARMFRAKRAYYGA
jgi:hypothetical protein